MGAIPATIADGSQVDAIPSRPSAVRRVTYLMLFRVVVAAVLLAAAVVAQLATASAPTLTPTAPALFTVAGATYALTIVWALLLRRVRRSPRAEEAAVRLGQAQVACDLATATLLVHVTGGVDSALVVLYVLSIVGAATVLPGRATLWATLAAALSFVAVALGGRLGLLPSWPGTPELTGPLAPTVGTLAVNLVALGATAVLAGRLSVELQRAGERIAAQGTLIQDIATLHADVVRSLASGLITVDHQGRVLSINPAGAEILGAAAPSALGRPLAELAPDLGAAATDGATPLNRAEVSIRRPDGEARIIGLSAMPLVDAAGRAVGRVVSFQDLSELKRMQREVERSERLAAIGRLAAAVAHEIRNPLAAISGSIELLKTPVEGEGAELWAIVEREVTRLNGLISDLLDFARPRAPEPAPVEVGEALAELAQVAAHDPRVGARLAIAVDGALWVDADLGQLKQVLWNLVRNAADATPGGEPIAVAAADDGEWVILTVRDRGPGIPEQERVRLGEPFFTTKKGGSGLGLAIVHRIVEEHRGRFELVNAEGGGAAAIVRLPRRSAP